MKIFVVLIFCVLVVQTLGGKGPNKPGPKPGPFGHPRRGPPPKRRQEPQTNANKGLGSTGWGSTGWGSSGWGWDGPPAYQTVSCVDPSADVVANYDADFLDRLRLWYMTGSTIYGYSLLARILLGRNVASQDELNQMCPAQVYSLSIDTCYNFGYGRTFQQNCAEGGTTVVSCPINNDPATYDGALGVNVAAAFVTQQEYMIATDNSTYVIWYVCDDSQYGDLQLTTSRPYASPEAVTAFLAAAQRYGIPQSQLQLSQCNSAYSGPYPSPFQNYPNGWSSGWGQTPTSGWNSQPSGWNAPSNGWSGNNNGWGGHSTLTEKQNDVKEESAKLAEEKPKA